MRAVPKETERIWRAFNVRLLGFISRRVSNRHDAEDILHDVFVKIHEKYHLVKDRERLSAWIYRITRNAIIDYYRKNKKAAVDIDSLKDTLSADFSGDDSLELMSCLKPFVENLSAEYREAFMMIDIREMSQKDYARHAGLTVSGAKSRVQRARSQLRNDLYDCCTFEFDDNGGIAQYTARNKTGGASCAGCLPEKSMK